MTKQHKKFIKILRKNFQKNPELRITQVLFNIGVNEFVEPNNPALANYQHKDNYNLSDIDLLKKICDIKQRQKIISKQILG